MVGLIAGTGLLGGLVGAGYLGVLHLVDRALGPSRWGDWSHLAILVAVGLVVAVLARTLGTPGDVELLVDNIHVQGGDDDIRRLRSLLPISLLCIGAGGPLGPEAPLVTTTGSLGSWLARRVGVSRDDLRVVSITGMAAGFTVLFGAPLGSALFALEILHRRGLEYYEALLPAVVGSLCGYGVSALLTHAGLDPIWHLPAPVALHAADLGFALAAGVVGALVAATFSYLTTGLRVIARRIPRDGRPVVGALVLGGLAMLTPYALTNGEMQIEHLTTTRVAVGTLLVAAAAKLISSAVALVTGWQGGFIIPLFFIGFCLGRATEGHLPGGASSWALAAALMVACNVGVTKTPLGSTLVVTEMAGMTLLPTTLVAAVVSLVLTSGVGLIDTQRRRIDPETPDESPAPDGTAPVPDGAMRAAG
jgi:H+/Cl- antiporter ClcA